MDPCLLLILYHPDNPPDIELLKKEAEIIPHYRIVEIDVTTSQGWMDSVTFHYAPGCCVVANKYKQEIVRLSQVPISFFQLRDWLLELGYRSAAKAISWDSANQVKEASQ